MVGAVNNLSTKFSGIRLVMYNKNNRTNDNTINNGIHLLQTRKQDDPLICTPLG